MKTKPKPVPALLKANTRYSDFHLHTTRYTHGLHREEKHRGELASRINALVLSLMKALSHYNYGRSRQQVSVYEAIDKGLSETIRRIRHNLFFNKHEQKAFLGYWIYIGGKLKEEAFTLKDLFLISAIEEFEREIRHLMAADKK